MVTNGALVPNKFAHAWLDEKKNLHEEKRFASTTQYCSVTPHLKPNINIPHEL